MAAALKIGRKKGVGVQEQEPPVLNTLDLSSCGVADMGVRTLAIAIEGSPGCVSNLILCNNIITDEGAIDLANGIIAGYKKSNNKCRIQSLDLSNNAGIGDDGAMALFEAVELGALCSLSLRSCSIKWQGFAGLGSTFGRMFSSRNNHHAPLESIEIDLSGNVLGKKEKKKKKKGLSSAVSTNMMNSMNFIGKRLKSGLKDVGINNIVGSSSLESDDEAEDMDSIGSELAEDQSSSRCGACEFYDSLGADLETKSTSDSNLRICLGLRMCNLDEDGINALGAACVLLGDSTKSKLCVDCTMNRDVFIEHDIIELLADGKYEDERLGEIAQTHLDVGYGNYDEGFGGEQYDEYDSDDMYPF